MLLVVVTVAGGFGGRDFVKHLSVGLRLLVVTLVRCVEVLQLPLERFERRSAHRVLVPALQHNLVKARFAVWRLRHAVAMLHLCQNLSVGHA